MSAVQSKWTPYVPSMPAPSTPYPIERARQNLLALAAQVVVRSADKSSAVSHGWNYTNSVTLGEAGGGTAAKPARKYWSHLHSGESGNKRVILKAELTYTGAVPTKIAYYFSSDNGATYVPLTDDDGNYVVTITYGGGGDITETTWGNTP